MSSSSLLGAAGEHYVMSQLLRRGLIAVLAPVGVPTADIVITDDCGERACALQVKTRRAIGSDGGWPMKAKHEEIRSASLYYVFPSFPSDSRQLPDAFVIPSMIVADALFTAHRAWLARPGRGGVAHKTARCAASCRIIVARVSPTSTGRVGSTATGTLGSNYPRRLHRLGYRQPRRDRSREAVPPAFRSRGVKREGEGWSRDGARPVGNPSMRALRWGCPVTWGGQRRDGITVSSPLLYGGMHALHRSYRSLAVEPCSDRPKGIRHPVHEIVPKAVPAWLAWDRTWPS